MSLNRSLFKSRFYLFGAVLAALGMALSQTAPTVAQEAAPQVLATQFFDAVGGNTSLMLFSSNTVLHTPEGEFTGRTGITRFGDNLEASFSNLAFSTQSAAQAGQLVIVSFALTGINTSSYQGMAANCAGIAVPGVAVLKVSAQQVVIEHFQMGPDMQQIPITLVDTQTVVSEQWIDYDSDVIASQISAFNQLDSNTRPACDAQNATEEALPSTIAANCLAANLCNLPH